MYLCEFVRTIHHDRGACGNATGISANSKNRCTLCNNTHVSYIPDPTTGDCSSSAAAFSTFAMCSFACSMYSA